MTKLAQMLVVSALVTVSGAFGQTTPRPLDPETKPLPLKTVTLDTDASVDARDQSLRVFTVDDGQNVFDIELAAVVVTQANLRRGDIIRIGLRSWLDSDGRPSRFINMVKDVYAEAAAKAAQARQSPPDDPKK